MITLRPGIVLTIGTVAFSTLVSGPGPLAAGGLQLTQTVTVTRVPVKEGASGWLGLGFQRIEAGVTDRIVIESIWPGGPADRAGLRSGDRVLELNGSPADMKMLESMSSRLAPGDPISLAVMRGSERLSFSLRADPRPSSATLVVERMQNQLDSVRHVMTMRLESMGSHPGSELPVLRVRPMSQSDTAVSVFVVMEAPSEPGRTVLPDSRWILADSTLHGSLVGSSSPESLSFGSFTLRGDLRVRTDSIFVNRARSAPLSTSVRPEARGTPAGRLILNRDSLLLRSPERAPGVLPANPFVIGMNRVAGAALQEIDARLGTYLGVNRGLLVTDVTEGTPAHRSGLRSGDVVVAADDRPVGTIDELRRVLALPGQEHTLEVTRLGNRRTVPLRR